jgi:PST family polysaccharide transporter
MFLREGVSEIIVFPSSMVLARLLTPREFGISAAAAVFILLSTRLSELGFNMALVRAKVLTPAHLSTVLYVNLIAGFVTFCALTAAAPYIATFYGIPEIRSMLPVAAISFLIAPLGTVPAALLMRDLRFREAAMVDWYQGLAFAVLTVVFALLGFSYWSFVYGRLGAVIVQNASRLYFAKWRPSFEYSSAALGDVFGFGAGVYVKRLLDYSAQNLDNLLVGKLMGVTALGVYDKAFSTMNRFLIRLNTSGPGVTFRIFAVIHEEPERFRRAYAKVMMSTSVFGFPLFGALSVMGTDLIVLLFGERWRPAGIPFQILCIAAALKVPTSYASAAIQATGRVWSEVWRQAAYVVAIVTSIYALRGLGVIGAAGAVLIATLMMALLMHVLLVRVSHLRWTEIAKPLMPGLAATLVTIAGVFAGGMLVRSVTHAPVLLLVLAVESAVGTACFIAFVLGAPHSELRTLVRETAGDLAPPFLKRQPWVRQYLAGPAVSQSVGQG